MAYVLVSSPNTSPLKRSFDQIDLSARAASYYEPLHEIKHHVERRSIGATLTSTNISSGRNVKRRNLSISSVTTMLAQSTTIMSGSFPSFMSVYGNEDNNIYHHTFSAQDAKTQQLDFPRYPTSTTQPILDSQSRFLERRGSLTSTTSYSNESSPTTTSSTFDSPLMPEPSPDSSPESASSPAPLKSFHQPIMRSTGTQTMDIPELRQNVLSRIPNLISEQAVEEPKRNLKKLTIDMKLPGLIKPEVGPTSNSLPFSAPASPLKEPLKTGRRKPNNLSIRTPGYNQLSFGANSLLIPPTPAQKSILHQAQSSPALPLLASPTRGPIGGMRLTLPNIAQSLNRDAPSNSCTSTLVANLPSLREEPYQPPQSQEAPEKGYTEGPCLIYDTGVYLYLEPDASEAAKFDTVINVAKEIKNPFETPSNASGTVMSVWRNADNRSDIPEPQTAVSEISYKSAFEWPLANGSATPTTPKAKTDIVINRPEYLHVKWDHNSEILDDLPALCQLIDQRVQEGKKVLIHCQLGVSRSASLIIAYGLYKGYEKDFHSMYMTVKKRSQWVGPNMSLIYQLTDFKSRCDKGEYINSVRAPKPEWFVYGAENAPTPTVPSQPAEENKPRQQPDVSADSRASLRLDKELPPIPPIANGQTKTIKKATSRALPFRAMGYSNQDMTIPPHRPRALPGLTFAQPSMDLAMQDVPAAPSLFSPRATEFMATPFGIKNAGDLVTSTPKTVQPPPGAFPGGTEWRNSLFLTPDTKVIPAVAPLPKTSGTDPRSPHQAGETREIFRSIYDVL